MDRVEIADSDLLYRRIHPSQIKPDRTASSAAFKGSGSEQLSVDLERLTTLEDVVRRGEEMKAECAGVGEIAAKDARASGQEVIHDPLGEGEYGGPNPAHSVIVGRKTDPIAKTLARKCRMAYWT